MQKMKLIGGALFVAMASAAGGANAAVAANTIITFNTMTQSAYSGKPNLLPSGNTIADCGGTGGANTGCYSQFGVAFGIVNDTSNDIAHLHRFGAASDYQLQYHSDSSGIYFRAVDGTAFSLSQMDFHAPITPENPIYGNNPASDPDTGAPMPLRPIVNPDTGEVTPLTPEDYQLLGDNEYWDIFGFNLSGGGVQATLDTTDAFGVATLVAHQTVVNGFDGTLLLDAAFQNVNSVWIHYHGNPQTPQDGIAYGMEINNVHLSTPAAVPVPAAAWLFGSALTGLVTLGRRKAGKTAA